MLLGPIFRAELLRSARRRQHYTLRVLYGLFLLILVWVGYRAWFRQAPTATIGSIASFAELTSATFGFLQATVLLIMIPPLFGGTIAGEKQRKTLHYLMATPLSSIEIILDKVLSRLPHLGVFLAIGFPVISILGLFGGISGEVVVLAYVGTVSTLTFAVALTVLVSTLARRVRDTVLIAYVLLIGWLFIPSLIYPLVRFRFPAAYFWIAPINDTLKNSSPFELWFRAQVFGIGGGINGMLTQFAWMLQLQVAMTALMLLLAVWQLRPAFRRQAASRVRRPWFAVVRRRHWFTRPACGDDAVFWKERYFASTARSTKLVLVLAMAAVTALLASVTEVDGRASQVFRLLWEEGYSASRLIPDNFLWALQVDFGWYAAIWLVAVASACASSVAGEREAETWVSLTSTPLTGWQIVRGKILGAVWNQRAFAAGMIGIWLVGLVTGYMHPLGIVFSAALVGLLTWLVAIIGIHASIRARTTARALGSTVGVLWLLNGHAAICVLWFVGGLGWESSFSVLGVMPRLVVGPLVSYEFVSESWRIATTQGVRLAPSANFVLVGVILLTIYVIAAVFCTWRVVRRFDFWLDRPRLTEETPRGRADSITDQRACGSLAQTHASRSESSGVTR